MCNKEVIVNWQVAVWLEMKPRFMGKHRDKQLCYNTSYNASLKVAITKSTDKIHKSSEIT